MNPLHTRMQFVATGTPAQILAAIDAAIKAAEGAAS
jgi:hypothetical protein